MHVRLPRLGYWETLLFQVLHSLVVVVVLFVFLQMHQMRPYSVGTLFYNVFHYGPLVIFSCFPFLNGYGAFRAVAKAGP